MRCRSRKVNKPPVKDRHVRPCTHSAHSLPLFPCGGCHLDPPGWHPTAPFRLIRHAEKPPTKSQSALLTISWTDIVHGGTHASVSSSFWLLDIFDLLLEDTCLFKYLKLAWWLFLLPWITTVTFLELSSESAQWHQLLLKNSSRIKSSYFLRSVGSTFLFPLDLNLTKYLGLWLFPILHPSQLRLFPFPLYILPNIWAFLFPQ